jgi:tRNA U34 2-thiouridine synthase MnmA/TrmU
MRSLILIYVFLNYLKLDFKVSFVREYWTDVFIPFLETYETGSATPNPDAACNRSIKFNHFRKHVIDDLGFDMMATGHYARYMTPDSAVQSNPRYQNNPYLDSILHNNRLLRGVDPLKDQSYFLCTTEVCILSSLLTI